MTGGSFYPPAHLCLQHWRRQCGQFSPVARPPPDRRGTDGHVRLPGQDDHTGRCREFPAQARRNLQLGCCHQQPGCAKPGYEHRCYTRCLRSLPGASGWQHYPECNRRSAVPSIPARLRNASAFVHCYHHGKVKLQPVPSCISQFLEVYRKGGCAGGGWFYRRLRGNIR
jgi:hypothetical protein